MIAGQIFELRVWSSIKTMWNSFTNSCHLEHHSLMVCPNVITSTLLDIVRPMMSLIGLPLSFWGYALETAAFTLNRAPSKSVETTPYELWFGEKPKLSFLKVWGCDAYVKKFSPDKLEPKSEKCVFIQYPKVTIGYTFYHRSESKIRC